MKKKNLMKILTVVICVIAMISLFAACKPDKVIDNTTNSEYLAKAADDIADAYGEIDFTKVFAFDVDLGVTVSDKVKDANHKVSLVAKGNFDDDGGTSEFYAEAKYNDKLLFGAYYADEALRLNFNNGAKKVELNNFSITQLFNAINAYTNGTSTAATAAPDTIKDTLNLVSGFIFPEKEDEEKEYTKSRFRYDEEQGLYTIKIDLVQVWGKLEGLAGSILDQILCVDGVPSIQVDYNGKKEGLNSAFITKYINENQPVVEGTLKVGKQNVSASINADLKEGGLKIDINSLGLSNTKISDVNAVAKAGNINEYVKADLGNFAISGKFNMDEKEYTYNIKANIDPTKLIIEGYSEEIVSQMGYIHAEFLDGDKKLMEIVFDPANSGDNNIYAYIDVFNNVYMPEPLLFTYNVNDLVDLIAGNKVGDVDLKTAATAELNLELIIGIARDAINAIANKDLITFGEKSVSVNIEALNSIYPEVLTDITKALFGTSKNITLTVDKAEFFTEKEAYNAYSKLDGLTLMKNIESADLGNLNIAEGNDIISYVNNNPEAKVTFNTTAGTTVEKKVALAKVIGYDPNKVGAQEVTMFFATESFDSNVGQSLNASGIPAGALSYTTTVTVVAASDIAIANATGREIAGGDNFFDAIGAVVKANGCDDYKLVSNAYVTKIVINGNEKYPLLSDKGEKGASVNSYIYDNGNIANYAGDWTVTLKVGNVEKEVTFNSYYWNDVKSDYEIKVGDKATTKIRVSYKYYNSETKLEELLRGDDITYESLTEGLTMDSKGKFTAVVDGQIKLSVVNPKNNKTYSIIVNVTAKK